ncbi:MAG: hypothetical protein H8D87_11515 [Deltaproteobacteria bacterium]|uniref:hypothetical protein n=1 Tax=Desulfobacula sp. TaxID=2593537 RepID=UPI0019B5A869|nr:hypothetical protein [Candidatus Desulfobacula maris]MBL6993792.1 hypothetical protein [Desulfobacula sp.]
MFQKKNRKLLILVAVVLVGVLFWGIPYLNKFQKNNFAPANNKTAIPQKTESNKQSTIVKTDNNKQSTIVKTDKTIGADNTVKPNETVTRDKAVKADKTIADGTTVKAEEVVTGGKIVKTDEIAQGKIIVLPDIDYKNLKKDEKLKQLMVSRKEELGLKKSLDMIVKSDETFKIGDVQIPLRDILEKASFKEGKVFEEKIEDSGAVQPEIIKKFGIYVVQPGDNIWNIHFNILKEFYEHQGIKISPVADEPLSRGTSSGIGKILKFSETMVIIYNFIEQKIDSNIELLEPLSKIIIYNMDEIFSLLQEVNYENIDRIQFDGKTIWVPTKKL